MISERPTFLEDLSPSPARVPGHSLAFDALERTAVWMGRPITIGASGHARSEVLYEMMESTLDDSTAGRVDDRGFVLQRGRELVEIVDVLVDPMNFRIDIQCVSHAARERAESDPRRAETPKAPTRRMGAVLGLEVAVGDP